jgi:hypothetical protein
MIVSDNHICRFRRSVKWSRRNDGGTTPLHGPLPRCLIPTLRHPVHKHRLVLIKVVFTVFDTPTVHLVNRLHHTSPADDAIHAFQKTTKGQIPEWESEPLPLARTEGSSGGVLFSQTTKYLGHCDQDSKITLGFVTCAWRGGDELDHQKFTTGFGGNKPPARELCEKRKQRLVHVSMSRLFGIGGRAASFLAPSTRKPGEPHWSQREEPPLARERPAMRI